MFGKKQDRAKLEVWKVRYSRNRETYEAELARMDRREALYRGSKEIRAAAGAERTRPAAHVRNIVAELVESQVAGSIPQPKVTALRREDEERARLIEDMLRNELDRLPMEYNNDQEERTVPIQGGALSLVEWDSTRRTHNTVGELCVTQLHPKKFIPQDGVWSDIEDMDYCFVLAPQTKRYIRERYGVDVSAEREQEPGARGADAEQTEGEDMVTQIMAYYRNRVGGIGLFSWVGDLVVEDLEDYQERKSYTCKKCAQRGDGLVCGYCGSKQFREDGDGGEWLTEDIVLADGRVIPAWSEAGILTPPSGFAGHLPDLGEASGVRWDIVRENPSAPAGHLPSIGEASGVRWDGGPPHGDSRAAANAASQAFAEQTLAQGGFIPTEFLKEMGPPHGDSRVGNEEASGDAGVLVQTKIPYYKPDIYPAILRKNVSVFGRFLGDSDVDKIEDQQETVKKLETQVIDKLFKGGSLLTAPQGAVISFTDEQLRVLRLNKPEDKQMLGVYNLQPDVSGDLNYLALVYEEARQITGITDSFQGRQDRTATSGVAKQIAVQQSAGRLESKRAMKDAYYARLFEAMFKFMLAYYDEPRTVVSTDNQGRARYKTFDRYEFLEQDAAGEWYWNDRFLFSVDASASLASNREAMWQECRMNLQQGAYGPPQELETLVMFWSRMEMLHYPGAGDTRGYLEEKLKRQQESAQMQMQADMGGSGIMTPPESTAPEGGMGLVGGAVGGI